MINEKVIRLWGMKTEALARIWVCGQCGAKVYCGRLAPRPGYRCLCGRSSWRAAAQTPPADRLNAIRR